ncbi:MAG: outer-membrane lipoprotein carrier protein LolA [Xanthobacteraceae bacterium]
MKGVVHGESTRARAGGAIVATALSALLAFPAFAEEIPLPKPAPTVRDGSVVVAQAGKPPAAGKPAPTAITPPNPIIPDPRKRAAGGLFTSFDAKQRAEAAKVSAYLSSLQTLVGQFVQVGPDGSRTTGDFYMQKPGKIRFEYDAPSNISIVADGQSVVVRDRKLATQDAYPLSQTPLRFLLADRIDLMRDTKVVGVSADDLYISITLEEQNPLVGTSRLMLMFGVKDNLLKQWTITDPQGYDTTVAVYNLDATKRPDPSMFKIDYTNYSTPHQ